MWLIPGDKMHMGPIWDFDLAFGNTDYADSKLAEGFWTKDNPWITRMFQDESFVSKVKTRFNYFNSRRSNFVASVNKYAQYLQFAQLENDKKWQTLGIYVWPNEYIYDTFAEENQHLIDWYNQRMNWLAAEFEDL